MADTLALLDELTKGAPAPKPAMAAVAPKVTTPAIEEPNTPTNLDAPPISSKGAVTDEEIASFFGGRKKAKSGIGGLGEFGHGLYVAFKQNVINKAGAIDRLSNFIAEQANSPNLKTNITKALDEGFGAKDWENEKTWMSKLGQIVGGVGIGVGEFMLGGAAVKGAGTALGLGTKLISAATKPMPIAAGLGALSSYGASGTPEQVAQGTIAGGIGGKILEKSGTALVGKGKSALIAGGGMAGVDLASALYDSARGRGQPVGEVGKQMLESGGTMAILRLLGDRLPHGMKKTLTDPDGIYKYPPSVLDKKNIKDIIAIYKEKIPYEKPTATESTGRKVPNENAIPGLTEESKMEEELPMGKSINQILEELNTGKAVDETDYNRLLLKLKYSPAQIDVLPTLNKKLITDVMIPERYVKIGMDYGDISFTKEGRAWLAKKGKEDRLTKASGDTKSSAEMLEEQNLTPDEKILKNVSAFVDSHYPDLVSGKRAQMIKTLADDLRASGTQEKIEEAKTKVAEKAAQVTADIEKKAEEVKTKTRAKKEKKPEVVKEEKTEEAPEITTDKPLTPEEKEALKNYYKAQGKTGKIDVSVPGKKTETIDVTEEKKVEPKTEKAKEPEPVKVELPPQVMMAMKDAIKKVFPNLNDKSAMGVATLMKDRGFTTPEKAVEVLHQLPKEAWERGQKREAKVVDRVRGYLDEIGKGPDQFFRKYQLTGKGKPLTDTQFNDIMDSDYMTTGAGKQWDKLVAVSKDGKETSIDIERSTAEGGKVAGIPVSDIVALIGVNQKEGKHGAVWKAEQLRKVAGKELTPAEQADRDVVKLNTNIAKALETLSKDHDRQLAALEKKLQNQITAKESLLSKEKNPAKKALLRGKIEDMKKAKDGQLRNLEDKLSKEREARQKDLEAVDPNAVRKSIPGLQVSLEPRTIEDVKDMLKAAYPEASKDIKDLTKSAKMILDAERAGIEEAKWIIEAAGTESEWATMGGPKKIAANIKAILDIEKSRMKEPKAKEGKLEGSPELSTEDQAFVDGIYAISPESIKKVEKFIDPTKPEGWMYKEDPGLLVGKANEKTKGYIQAYAKYNDEASIRETARQDKLRETAGRGKRLNDQAWETLKKSGEVTDLKFKRIGNIQEKKELDPLFEKQRLEVQEAYEKKYQPIQAQLDKVSQLLDLARKAGNKPEVSRLVERMEAIKKDLNDLKSQHNLIVEELRAQKAEREAELFEEGNENRRALEIQVNKEIKSDLRRGAKNTDPAPGPYKNKAKIVTQVSAPMVGDPNRNQGVLVVLDPNVPHDPKGPAWANRSGKRRFTFLSTANEVDPYKDMQIPTHETKFPRIVGHMDVVPEGGKYRIVDFQLEPEFRSNEKFTTSLLTLMDSAYFGDGKDLRVHTNYPLPEFEGIKSKTIADTKALEGKGRSAKEKEVTLGPKTVKFNVGIDPEDVSTTVRSLFNLTRRVYQNLSMKFTGSPWTLAEKSRIKEAIIYNDLTRIPEETMRKIKETDPRNWFGKNVNVFELFGDLQFSTDERLAYLGKMILDKTNARGAYLEWADKWWQEKIMNRVEKAEQEGVKDARGVFAEMCYRGAKSPNANLTDALLDWKDLRDNMAEKLKLEEKGLYISDYFPLLVDHEQTYTKLRNRWLQNFGTYDEFQRKNPGSFITEPQYRTIMGIFNERQTWKNVPSTQKTLIERDVYNWAGIYNSWDTLPDILKGEGKSQLNREAFNKHLKHRGGERGLAYNWDGPEVIRQYLRTMTMKTAEQDILKTAQPVLSAMGEPSFLTKRWFAEKKVREMLYKPTKSEQFFREAMVGINDILGKDVVDPNFIKNLSSFTVGRVAQGALGLDTAFKHAFPKMLNTVILEPGTFGPYFKAVMSALAGKGGAKIDGTYIKTLGLSREMGGFPETDMVKFGSRGSWNQMMEAMREVEKGKLLPAEVKKAYMMYDWIGNKWIHPIAMVEQWSKGLTFNSFMAKAFKEGKSLDESYVYSLAKISDMVPDLKVPAMMHEAAYKTLQVEFGYGKQYRSPLMNGPLASISTIFWNFPGKMAQLGHNGFINALADGDLNRFIRYNAWIGMQVTTATALMKLGLDAGAMFGHFLPVFPISVPWDILKSTYDYLGGAYDHDSDRKRQGWEHFMNAIQMMSIPGYRYGKKAFQALRNIDEGVARSQKTGQVTREATPMSEFLSMIALPVAENKEVFDLQKRMDYRAAEQSKDKADLIRRGAAAIKNKSGGDLQAIFKEAQEAGIPLTHEDLMNRLNKNELQTSLEQKYARLPANLKQEFLKEYQDQLAKSFPSRYGKRERSMWSRQGRNPMSPIFQQEEAEEL